jgi:hypothetical protein
MWRLVLFCWSVGNNNLSYPVSLCGDSCYFVGFHEKSMYFLKQKAVGSGFFLRASTQPFSSPYCSGATLRVCLCDALFPSCRLDLPEVRFRYVSSWSLTGQRFALP